MPVSIFDIISKGAELSNKDPEVKKEMAEADGDKVCFRFTDDVPVTVMTVKGKLVVESKERPDSQVVMELSALPFCDVLDKTLELIALQTKAKLVKGEVADVIDHIFALIPFFKAMVSYYSKNPQFKKMVDERKSKK